LLQAGQLDEAETLIRKALVSSPRDAKATSFSGNPRRRGRAADAENQYREALKLEPSNAQRSRTSVSYTRVQTGSTRPLRRSRQRCGLTESAQAVFNLGALYAARGDYQRAVPLLERAAGPSLNANNTPQAGDLGLLLTLVSAYAHTGREKEATALADHLEKWPATILALCSLLLSLAEAHQYARAIELFERTNKLHLKRSRFYITWESPSTMPIVLTRRHKL